MSALRSESSLALGEGLGGRGAAGVTGLVTGPPILPRRRRTPAASHHVATARREHPSARAASAALAPGPDRLDGPRPVHQTVHDHHLQVVVQCKLGSATQPQNYGALTARRSISRSLSSLDGRAQETTSLFGENTVAEQLRAANEQWPFSFGTPRSLSGKLAAYRFAKEGGPCANPTRN